ncbi:MAG: hypothetical protein HQ565_09540 [Bacteroidetes bacterium]|nr:hypothetical protein [Bacteroidota bacterium]
MQKLFAGTFLSIILLLGAFTSFAQDDNYDWWNKKHNWDGVTNWARYLIYSPAYLGPNALAVPEIRDALLEKRIFIETAADLHFSSGDNTQDLFLKFHYPFLDGRVAVELYGVPIEYFIMDTITRDERRGRDLDARGFAAGDLYIATLIQLLRDHGQWPDLLLGITMRTASGGNLGNARYTDAPGYFFDLSAGKSFKAGDKLSLRPYMMLGFYVWQTNRDDYRQNDAFLYGAGISLYGNSFECNAKFGGYKGYIGNGDAPMVLRANTIYKLKKTDLKLTFQQGIKDFSYSSLSMGVTFYF